LKIIDADEVKVEEKKIIPRPKVNQTEFYKKEWIKKGCPLPGCKLDKDHEMPHNCFLDQEVHYAPNGL
jgi:hypothetical protein